MPWPSIPAGPIPGPLPGYSTTGFAPRDFAPLYPELWKNCVLAVNQSLGHTGNTIYDWSGQRRHGSKVAAGATALYWLTVDSLYATVPTNNGNLMAWDFGDYAGTLLSGAVSFWVRPSFFTSERTMFGYSSDISTWNLRLGSTTDGTPSSGNSYLVMRVADGVISNTIRGSTVFVTGQWFHIAVVSANDQYYMWVNGVPQTLTILAGSNNGKWFGHILKAGTIKLSWASSIWFSTVWSTGLQGRFTDLRLFGTPISDGIVDLLARRPGIAYEFDSLSYKVPAAAFNSAWARGSNILTSPGSV